MENLSKKLKEAYPTNNPEKQNIPSMRIQFEEMQRRLLALENYSQKKDTYIQAFISDLRESVHDMASTPNVTMSDFFEIFFKSLLSLEGSLENIQAEYNPRNGPKGASSERLNDLFK